MNGSHNEKASSLTKSSRPRYGSLLAPIHILNQMRYFHEAIAKKFSEAVNNQALQVARKWFKTLSIRDKGKIHIHMGGVKDDALTNEGFV